MNTVRRLRARLRLRRLKGRHTATPWLLILIICALCSLGGVATVFLIHAPTPRTSADFAAWVQGIGTIAAVVVSGVLMHVHERYQRAVNYATLLNAANICVHAAADAVLQLDRAYRKAAIFGAVRERDALYLAAFPAGWTKGWLLQQYTGLLDSLDDLRLGEVEEFVLLDVVMIVRVRLGWLIDDVCPTLARTGKLNSEMQAKLEVAALDVLVALGRLRTSFKEHEVVLDRCTYFSLDPAVPPDRLSEQDKRRWRQFIS